MENKKEFLRDVNWVQACLDCTTEKLFSQLVARVESDVNIWLSTLPEQAQANVQFSSAYPGQYFVSVRSYDGTTWIRFTRKDKVILVERENGTQFEFAPLLNDHGDCLLTLHGVGELELWQVSRRALEDLLMSRKD